MKKRIIILLLIIGIILAGLIWFGLSRQQGALQLTPATTPTTVPQQAFSQAITIDHIGLRLAVPQGYTFAKEEHMNLTTYEAYAVSFTIQNYVGNPGEVSNPYQLYGLYQWDTATSTEEEFKKADFMLIKTSQKEFLVDGLPAVSGVTTGERGRYSVYILKDGHILFLAADGSTDDHKRTTHSILETMKFE